VGEDAAAEVKRVLPDCEQGGWRSLNEATRG